MYKINIDFLFKEFLYNYIIPWVLNNNIQTRKHIDFLLWTLLIIIIKHGLSKNLQIILKKNINTKRYKEYELPDIEDLIYVLSLTLKLDPI